MATESSLGRSEGEVASGRTYDAIGEYLSFLSVEKGASPLTVRFYACDLRDYESFLARRGADCLSASCDDILAFEGDLLERGYAPSSRERHVSAVKGFHRFMVREGLSPADPSIGIALPKVPLRLPDVLSIDAVNRVLDQDMRADEIGLNRPCHPGGPIRLRLAGKRARRYGQGRCVFRRRLRARQRKGFERANRPLGGHGGADPCSLPRRSAPRFGASFSGRCGDVSERARIEDIEAKRACDRRSMGTGGRHQGPSSAYAASLVCDPYARRRCRSAHHPRNPRSFRHRYDADIHARFAHSYARRIPCLPSESETAPEDVTRGASAARP